jgi:hypothetical protein
MVTAANKKNVPIDHKAKLFEETYFKIFDPIIAVDHEVLKALQSMAHSDEERAKLHLISEYSNGQEMADPYFDGEAGFDKTMAMSQEIALAILAKEVVAKLKVRRFSGLFWPLFAFFEGSNIRKLILLPSKKSKIGSKEPENRQNLKFCNYL